MKNKHWIVVLTSFVIIVLVILFILYYLISNLFSMYVGKKMKDTSIIELFKSNNLLFQNAVDELIDIETITISKETNTSYTIIINNSEEIFIDINNYSSEYTNCIKLMENLNVIYLYKEYDNVEFIVNSMFGLGQSVVLISDIEKYKYTHSVTKIQNIYNNWYYIETK